MNLKQIGTLFTSKFVGAGPSCYKKRIYRAAVSQRLSNIDIHDMEETFLSVVGFMPLQSHHPVYGYCTSTLFRGFGYME